MVLTDVPFDRPNLIQDRYNLLLRPGVTLDDSESSEEDDDDSPNPQNYAKFLKDLNKKDKEGEGGRQRPYSDGPAWLRDKERMCGPDGFVDSSRHQNRFRVKGDKKEQRGKNKTSKSFTVVDLAAIKERDQKEYEKRFKLIDDHMWQHKQEERELKRFEGDIIKNQRAVRKEMRDYENAITRKRMAEEKKLNQGLERFTDLQKQHLHKKEETVNQRRDKNVAEEVAAKDADRKVQLTTSDMARQYRTKISELELKRIELSRLNEDFESRLRRKEEEQFKLKQELAELAIVLNMEAQKGRVQEIDRKKDGDREKRERIDTDLKVQSDLDTKLAKSDGVQKGAINEKRKLSANLTLTKAHLQLKQREENRSKYDTEQQLKINRAEQAQLREAALHADLDLKQKKIDQKITEVNSRKHVQLMTVHTEKKETREQQEKSLSTKFSKRLADQNRREHEDHLKHFQKSVQMGEEQEYVLYNKVKNAEYSRQKQEQSVRKLHGKLLERKRENAEKLKKEMLGATREEQELSYKIERERADLAKSHAQREENYMCLQTHRQRLQQERFMLSEHSREHHRLIKIGQHTEQTHAQREEMYLKLQKHRHQLNSDRTLLTRHAREQERLLKIGLRTEQEAAEVGVQ